jgi:hypothetical protein
MPDGFVILLNNARNNGLEKEKPLLVLGFYKP